MRVRGAVKHQRERIRTNLHFTANSQVPPCGDTFEKATFAITSYYFFGASIMLNCKRTTGKSNMKYFSHVRYDIGIITKNAIIVRLLRVEILCDLVFISRKIE
jgi:hypothetical protein